MSLLMELARFVVRQAEEAVEGEAAPEACSTANDFDGRMGIRISSIFVILIGSTLGKCVAADH
jgi:zinc transporter 1/2/3